jgi:hypothetical protein
MKMKRQEASIDVCGKDVRVQGGFIRQAHLDAEGYNFLEDPAEAIAVLKKSRPRADLFTFTQKLTDLTPRYSYLMEWDNLAVLPVTSLDHWMKNQIDFKARNKSRKAGKAGVEVKEVPFDDALIEGICGVYNESEVRQGRKFWHYGKDFEGARKTNGTYLDRSIFIGAYLGGELIGFIKLVTNEDKTQAGLMQIVAMIKHRDKAPTNALIAQAINACAVRGIPYLWYANFSYGKKEKDSLAEFKLNNGFRKVEIPRYYVPLTAAGHVALKLGMQHKFSERVPESIAAPFRKVRAAWYAQWNKATDKQAETSASRAGSPTPATQSQDS